MLKHGAVIIIAVVVLAAAVFVGVKAELVRPNMLFVPEGVKGVDVSEHQGAIDLEALSQSGIEFVYAKATEGATHVDSQFAATCGLATGSRVALGAYHFFSFDTPGSDQAANFVASASKAWIDSAIRSLRPAVDVEWYGDKEQNPPQEEDVRRELKAFLEEVEAACGQNPSFMRATISTTDTCGATSTATNCGSRAASGPPGSNGRKVVGPSGNTATSASLTAPPIGRATSI